jgi:hypothetical protein
MKIFENFNGDYSLCEMDSDDLVSLRNIIRSSCLVDKRNFTKIDNDIKLLIENKNK